MSGQVLLNGVLANWLLVWFSHAPRTRLRSESPLAKGCPLAYDPRIVEVSTRNPVFSHFPEKKNLNLTTVGVFECRIKLNNVPVHIARTNLFLLTLCAYHETVLSEGGESRISLDSFGRASVELPNLSKVRIIFSIWYGSHCIEQCAGRVSDSTLQFAY